MKIRKRIKKGSLIALESKLTKLERYISEVVVPGVERAQQKAEVGFNHTQDVLVRINEISNYIAGRRFDDEVCEEEIYE